jgi:hypothetical protein
MYLGYARDFCTQGVLVWNHHSIVYRIRSGRRKLINSKAQEKMMSPRTAAIALLFALMAISPVYADDDSSARPLIEGELDTGLSTDRIFRSDDPTAEITDLYAEAALAVKLNAANWLAFNLGLTFEPVLDPQASTDRYFGDHGLYVDTLNIQIENAGFIAVAGKFGPGFGTAWDVTPGIYGTGFAEDYELSEMVGFGTAYAFDAGAPGVITIGGNVFFMDDTFLSGSAFTKRGRNLASAGGPGNTGRLNNFSLTVDGSDIPAVEGLNWHLGYVHLGAGAGDISAVNGFAAGLVRETELGNGVAIGWNTEIAYFDGANGSKDKALYLTGGLSVAKGPWHGEASATLRRTNYFAGGRDNDLLAQVSGGYEFENGVDLSLGYAFARQAGVRSHTVGFRLTKAFEFSIPRN